MSINLADIFADIEKLSDDEIIASPVHESSPQPQPANTFVDEPMVCTPVQELEKFEDIQVSTLNTKAVLVHLRRSMYSPYKLDQAESKAYGAGNVNKHLFEGRDNRVRQTISKFSEVRQFVNDNTVPWSTGVRLLNMANYLDFTASLRVMTAEALAAADDLAANWDDEVSTDLDRLAKIAYSKGKPDLANPDDYPHASEIRERFGIEVDFSAVPTTGDFRVAISEEDKASVNRQVQKRMASVAKHVISEMLEPMQRAVDKLNVPIGHEGAFFRDSLIDNIVNVADRMDRVNLSDDPVVTDKIASLKSLASTYADNKDVLRSMPDVRKKAATQINDLVSQMAGLV